MGLAAKFVILHVEQYITIPSDTVKNHVKIPQTIIMKLFSTVCQFVSIQIMISTMLTILLVKLQITGN